jgi:hypothetical protein
MNFALSADELVDVGTGIKSIVRCGQTGMHSCERLIRSDLLYCYADIAPASVRRPATGSKVDETAPGCFLPLNLKNKPESQHGAFNEIEFNAFLHCDKQRKIMLELLLKN